MITINKVILVTLSKKKENNTLQGKTIKKNVNLNINKKLEVISTKSYLDKLHINECTIINIG